MMYIEVLVFVVTCLLILAIALFGHIARVNEMA